VAAAAAGDADVEALGVDLVDPGFSYLNLRFVLGRGKGRESPIQLYG
jgi:hypothetical protein